MRSFVRIANPIYDVVFKYMMEDRKVARAFISASIGEEVLEQDFCPQELTVKYRDESYTVIRMDFLAKIRVPGGQKVAIIEMQKAQFASDIRSFRRYLGSQYESDRNIYTDERQTEHAMQIYCIFFLGKRLDIPDVPVLAVTNQMRDRTTEQEVYPHSEFIVSRLKQADEFGEIEVQMRAEDELSGDFQNMERQIAARDEVIGIKNRELEEKDRALAEALEKIKRLEDKN